MTHKKAEKPIVTCCTGNLKFIEHLSAEKMSDADRNHYQDELPAFNSPTDSESNTEMDTITHEEV